MTDSLKNPFQEYLVDAAQRGVLLLDTLRQRGNRSREQEEKDAPHVLEFEFEHMYRDGWLPRLAEGDDARLLWYFHLAHGSNIGHGRTCR